MEKISDRSKGIAWAKKVFAEKIADPKTKVQWKKNLGETVARQLESIASAKLRPIRQTRYKNWKDNIDLEFWTGVFDWAQQEYFRQGDPAQFDTDSEFMRKKVVEFQGRGGDVDDDYVELFLGVKIDYRFPPKIILSRLLMEGKVDQLWGKWGGPGAFDEARAKREREVGRLVRNPDDEDDEDTYDPYADPRQGALFDEEWTLRVVKEQDRPDLAFESADEYLNAFLDDDLNPGEELSWDTLADLIKQVGDIEQEEIEFQDGTKILLLTWQNSKYVLDRAEEEPRSETARHWLDRNIEDAEDFFEVDPLESFWASPAPLYHATDRSNLKAIMRRGLRTSSKTRGLTNRGIGSAVFTSLNPEAIDSYGDLIFMIDTLAMVRDGYTPELELEPGIAEHEAKTALVSALDMDEDYLVELDSSDGIDYETVIIYGDILPKYLSTPFE